MIPALAVGLLLAAMLIYTTEFLRKAKDVNETQQIIENNKRSRREEHLHNRIESAKLDIDAGLSYKAASRKNSVPLELCKELKDKSTGRFFFDKNKKGERSLVAEKINPISGMSNAPKGATFYRNAPDAYAGVRGEQ